MKENIFVERNEYNNVITVKIVVPTGCNAKSTFCYNNDKDMTCNKKVFLSNFMISLIDILNKIGNKNPVSIDITGGEPTLDVPLIKEILYVSYIEKSIFIQRYSKISKYLNSLKATPKLFSSIKRTSFSEGYGSLHTNNAIK